ncbi:hypothetical protein K6W36_12220 [Acetobacter senegalensis]|uniref:hypothetical protein n=1 Tax=Acetobacter senegalensis TaxID=446692 RepID=UPI001EDA21C6|nr:hypothetical protein [Acetobacter senegalensis]MCG4261330.1 hypothetical protein [Acetobacter senegalensis]
MMDTDDFYALVDAAGRDEDAYVSIDRLRISRDFLDSLCDENEQIKSMSVIDLIALMDETL